MARTFFTIFILLFSFSSKTNAQKFVTSIGASGGITDNGFAVLGYYNHYTNKDYHFLQGSIFAAFSTENYKNIKVDYNTFTFSGGYFHNLFRSRSESFKFSIGGGGVIGYEVINDGENLLENGGLIQDKSKMIYGGFIGIDTDIFLTEYISFVVKANQYYHSNSDMGKFTIFAGAGIRIFVN